MAERYKDVAVEMEPIFIRDGDVYTTAGITAGMDLALALVEQDYGSSVSGRVAKDLVLYLRRAGNQAQYSKLLALQNADREPIAEIIAWMNEHLDERLSVERLANRVGMSARNFARVFVAETRHPPGQFVELLRTEAAKRLLETSQLPVKHISASCGFADTSSLRRAFSKWVRLSPQNYRLRFHQ